MVLPKPTPDKKSTFRDLAIGSSLSCLLENLPICLYSIHNQGVVVILENIMESGTDPPWEERVGG